MSDPLIVSPVIRAVGLALAAFLWQGSAIGVLSAVVLRVLARATSRARYGVACFGLAAMLAAPVATALSLLNDAPIALGTMSEQAEIAITSVNSDAASPTRPPFVASSQDWLDRHLPLVVILWSVGVFGLSLQLLAGCWSVVRIRRAASSWPSAHWAASISDMANRLRIARRIRLLASPLVDTPAVIGWLRPVIVVPVGVLSGLSPAHLEAILAHELAHIRRGDYVVNVAQRVVETLLFYHPAVWWLSRRIRVEREHCCDDMAVALLVDRVAYADALTSLEELRADLPALALSARGGSLLGRIRRIVEPTPNDDPRWSGGIAMTAAIALVLLVVGGQLSGSKARVVEPDAAPALEPARPIDQGPERGPTLQVQGAAAVNSASLSGAVTDPQGGVIPGALVRMTSADGPAFRRDVPTNAAGGFVFADLPGGRYVLVVSAPGFKSLGAPIEIADGERMVRNVRLPVGGLAETVRVVSTPAPPAVRVQSSPTPTLSAPLVPVRVPNTVLVPLPVAPSSSAPANRPAPSPQTAAEYLDRAKQFYDQGRIEEAELMATRALDALRAIRQPRPSGFPIRVGGDIKAPTKIKSVNPIYPPDARAAGIQGIVILEATIATDGSVRDAVVLRSVPGLDEAALGAVREWNYTPTLLNGEPVEVVMTVTVNFSLN